MFKPLNGTNTLKCYCHMRYEELYPGCSLSLKTLLCKGHVVTEDKNLYGYLYSTLF